MSNIAKVVLSVLVTFFLTLALNSLVQWIAHENGLITIGSDISIGNTDFYTFSLENYTRKSLDGLHLLVAKDVNVAQIEASTPLSIEVDEFLQGSPNEKRLTISGFPSRRITSVFLPKPNGGNGNGFSVLNHLALKLKTEMSQERRSPLYQILRNALLTTLIYSAFFALTLFHNYYKRKTRQKVSKLEQKLKDVYTESKDDLNSVRKAQLLLSARLHDYAKELSFWRDTIRRVMYAAGEGKEAANNLIRKVQQGLKTYKADSKIIDDFESIKLMAHIVGDSQEQHKAP